MADLPIATIQTMINAAEARAMDLGLKVSIAVVDEAAFLKAFHRMDGASLASVDIACRKARTSALFRRDSGEFGQMVIDNQLMGIESTNGGLAPFPGGLPIKIDGVLYGAIGVSGATKEEDRDIASHGLSSL